MGQLLKRYLYQLRNNDISRMYDRGRPTLSLSTVVDPDMGQLPMTTSRSQSGCVGFALGPVVVLHRLDNSRGSMRHGRRPRGFAPASLNEEREDCAGTKVINIVISRQDLRKFTGGAVGSSAVTKGTTSSGASRVDPVAPLIR